MFITKRQQEALRCLQAGHLYKYPMRGYSYRLVGSGFFFSVRTLNILIDAGWAGRIFLSEDESAYAGESIVALTPEGRKLARLLSARSK